MYYQTHTACMETNKSITLICFDKCKYNFWGFNNYISQSRWSWHAAVCYLEKGKQVFTSPGWLLLQPECEGAFTSFLSFCAWENQSKKVRVKDIGVLCLDSIHYYHLLTWYLRKIYEIIVHKNHPLLDWHKSTNHASSPNPFQYKVSQGYCKHL